MNRNGMALFASLMLLALLCAAQPEDFPPAPAAPPAFGAPAPEAEPEGDTVVFKKGTELKGVKVVRHSPMFVEIEYLPGEPYLQIPVSQVAEVIYAERQVASRDPGEAGVPLGPDVMPGEEVSAEFHQLLITTLSEESLEYVDADYLAVILELAQQVGVSIDVDENLAALSPEERRFTHTVPPGTSFLLFLRRNLQEIAPDVRVILHYDRLALQRRVSLADPAPSPAPVPAPDPAAQESYDDSGTAPDAAPPAYE